MINPFPSPPPPPKKTPAQKWIDFVRKQTLLGTKIESCLYKDANPRFLSPNIAPAKSTIDSSLNNKICWRKAHLFELVRPLSLRWVTVHNIYFGKFAWRGEELLHTQALGQKLREDRNESSCSTRIGDVTLPFQTWCVRIHSRVLNELESKTT